MRIATSNSYEAGLGTLTQRQTELAQSQERLTSGKRVARASDDPAAAARAERALAREMRSQTSQRAVDASRSAMEQTEGAIADGTELLQDARELLVAAGNAAYGDAERQALSARLRGIREQLFAVANRSDGAGSYVFGGQAASAPPFVDAPGGVQFRATTGAMRTEESTALPLSSDGAATWMRARTGNGFFETRVLSSTTAWIDNGRVTDPAALTDSTYTLEFSVSGGTTSYAILKDGAPTAAVAEPYVDGQAIELDGMSFSVNGSPGNGDRFEVLPASSTLTVFDALDQAVAELATPARTSAQVAQSSADNLRRLDAVLGTMQAARSEAGQVLNRIDAETSRLADQTLAAQGERSAAEDLDMVQAISDFQTRQTGYDAALKSYSMVQRMSLFQYLNT